MKPKSGPNSEAKEFREVFFLFEDNPLWHAIAAEGILSIAKTRKVDVYLCSALTRFKLARKTWTAVPDLRMKIRLFCTTFLRELSWTLIRNTRPTRILEKEFARIKNVRVFTVSRDYKEQSEKVRNSSISSEMLHALLIHIENVLMDLHRTANLKTYAKKDLEALREIGMEVLELITSILKENPYDRVNIVSGKTLYEGLVTIACKELSLNCVAHECEGPPEKRRKFSMPNSVVDALSLSHAIEMHWTKMIAEYGASQLEQIGKAFYRRRQVDPYLNGFLRKFKSADWVFGETQLRVGFFSSSTEELVSFFRSNNLDVVDQEELISSLINYFKTIDLSRAQLLVRVHPHMAMKKSEDRKFYDHLKSDGAIEVINYNSTINTYDLIRQCDIVLGTASTVLAEAAIMGKATYSFGDSLFLNLGISSKLSHPREIFERPKIGSINAYHQALKFGLFSETYGNQFEFLNAKTLQFIDTGVSLDVLHTIESFFRYGKITEEKV